jgi:hypothetical protein
MSTLSNWAAWLNDATACWPPATTGPPTARSSLRDWNFGGWGFYSPGLVCPGGYTSACSAIANQTAALGWDVEYSMLAGETAVGCCPRHA